MFGLKFFTTEEAERCRCEDRKVTCSDQETQPFRSPPTHTPTPRTPYLRGDPMSEVGGVGLLPALCRRLTACRRNVLRSRRNMTVSSLPGAVVARDVIGPLVWICFLSRKLCFHVWLRRFLPALIYKQQLENYLGNVF